MDRLLKSANILVVVLIAMGFAWAAARQVRGNSVTVDEFYHVSAGTYYLEKRAYDLDHGGNPPLLRKWIALPVARMRPQERFNAHGGEIEKHWNFMMDNFEEYPRMINAARVQIVLLGAALGLFVYFAALRMYGTYGATVALGLCCFSCTVLAHTTRATLDAGMALFTVLSMACFYFLCAKPSIKSALVCGIAAGACLCAKYSGVSVVFIQILCIAAVWFYRRISARCKAPVFTDLAPLKSVIPWYAFSLCVAALTLNADYGFQGFMQPVSEMPLRSHVLSGMASAAWWLRLPLPTFYVLGVDRQFSFMNNYHQFYLLGDLSRNGWPHYFLAAYMVKESIPAIILFALSLVSVFRMRLKTFEIFSLITAASIFALYSFVLRVDIGIRYLLPALPFIYIFSARIIPYSVPKRFVPIVALIAALLAWHITAALITTPHALAYFNEIAGGSYNGHNILLDSNCDWGGNLIALKDYMKKNKIKTIKLYNYGIIPPQMYGIDPEWLLCGPTDGHIAISVNYLHGVDPFQNRPKDCFEWLLERKPTARLGKGGTLVFDIE
jgi:hypothetical protein